jgi:hypothetical protein
MEWRGVSDDISRGPIPTLEYLKTQIRTLAEYKINLLGFNMEHVFDFQGQPLFAPKGRAQAALTPAEIKELVDYAASTTSRLLPEQQAFGHLHQFLKYEIYSDLAETPHGHVLTPTNPKTYDFIRQVYGEVVALFPGPFFHIGSDETFELGRGPDASSRRTAGTGPRLSRTPAESLRDHAALSQATHVLGRHRGQVSGTADHSSQRHDRRSLGLRPQAGATKTSLRRTPMLACAWWSRPEQGTGA